ncbi:DUF3592 domain-containing protein [Nocardiopsis alba]|uniref:DUF3592 domain-containing protein n=1 Tax=Nocardiopsis alba TaxID=53437 RepID=UPI0034097A66
MSTVDPAAAREARLRRLVGSPKALILTLVGGLTLVLAGGAVGYAVSAIMDRVRVSTVNSVFSDTESTMAYWVTPIAAIGSIIGFLAYSHWSHRYSGGRSIHPRPVTLWFLGIAVTMWWATTYLWAPVDMVGTAIDPVFGEHEAWGTGAWFSYAMRWWAPGLATIVFVLSLVFGFLSRVRERRGRELLGRLLREGTRTTGEVTELTLPVSNDSGPSVTHWTFSFTDLRGQRRWVQRIQRLPRGRVLSIGGPVTVLYDPSRPHDTSRIFVALEGGDRAEDYLGPGLRP